MSGKVSDLRKFPKSRLLLKHPAFQRVVQQAPRQFSVNLTIYVLRRESALTGEPRVGLTVGKVLGGAVERNRIKRRMREAVRLSRSVCSGAVDVVFNPRKSVMTMSFPELLNEVGRGLKLAEQ